MCGIAGFVRLNGQPIDQAMLDRMTDAVAHRGPNARGTFTHENVGLGHRRLSILDLTTAGSQPMVSDDGTVVLSFNGEIYNFALLRQQLERKGHVFHSRSDTEVLLHLYQEYGVECLQHLRGMFAFAVYDKRKRQIFLARDRIGKKPLKYFASGGVFAFASELKALRTLPQCPREVDREAVHHFLTMMYLPAPRTGFVGIHKLPAGHYLLLDTATGAHAIRPYWELSYDTDETASEEQWRSRILSTLEESVKLRMVADVPVGAFLSGGIDSGTVVALMSKLSDKPVQTFSVGSSDPAMNELPLAEMVAKRYGTDHHPILLEADVATLLPELVHTYEEPYADPSAIPTYLIAQVTRSHVTVALNGDGGDENFGGYVRYPILLFSEQWKRAPAHSVARLATRLFHMAQANTFSYRAQRFEQSMDLPWPERFLQYISFFTEEEKRSLYRSGFAEHFGRTDEWYAAQTVGARSRAHDTLHQAMAMDMHTYLPDDLMPKVDLGSMAHGLEARSPFLDHELLELTARMPARFKVRGRSTKWILRRMAKDLLPPDILSGRKRGFRIPLDKWFRNELKHFVRDRLLTGNPLFWEIFDRAKIEQFLRMYWSSGVNYSDHVWALLWLAEWCSQYGA
jgi:asparagine synthase (glutamine-hydrolysing)